MPARKLHLIFDEYLKQHEILLNTTYAVSVHDRMDRGLTAYGPDHQIIDFYHSEEGIRAWLDALPETTRQDTKTDYLRVALGHLMLDDMKYRLPDASDEELIKAAYRSFMQRGFDRTFYKEPR